MALVVNDRVKETSTTTGTGTFTLDGAVTGFETFSSAIGNSNTTYYAIEIPNTTEFEVGLGTVSAGQLARTTVISSSNSDALVNFSAGTKNVFCTLPASKATVKDADGRVGIGKATPTAALEIGGDGDTNLQSFRVNASTNSEWFSVGVGGAGVVRFNSQGGNTRVGAAMDLGARMNIAQLSSSAAALALAGGQANNILEVNSANSDLGGDLMVIDENGLVGIGTTSPTYTLESLGSGTDGAFAVFHNQGSGGAYSGVQIASANQLGGGNSDTNLTITRWNGVGTKVSAVKLGVESNNNDGVLTFSTAENADFNSSTYTERMRIDGDTGNVGIGTTSPSAKLDVSHSAADVGSFIRNNNSGSGQIKLGNSDGFVRVGGNNGTFEVYNSSNTSARLFIDNVGNVGLGNNTSPSSLLHLSSSDPQITITDTDGTGSQVIKAVGDDFTIDAAANITLDVGGANGINLYKDNGPKGLIYFLSDNLNIKPTESDKDLVIKGNDGGAEITALTLDMSEAGAATFNSSVTVGANLDVSSGTIKLDGNYPTGTNNVAMGDTALDSIGTGGAGHNVAIGHAALTADNTGTGNVGIGAFALTSTVTGNYSTAIGQEALKVNTASWNNAIGFQSMLTSVGGEKNIAMGFWSLKNLGSNDKNVAIGHEAGINLTGGDNNIIIGHNAQAASATTSNQITLGDANITSLRIPGLQSGALSGDVLTYDGTDIGFATPSTGVSAGFVIAMSIAL